MKKTSSRRWLTSQKPSLDRNKVVPKHVFIILEEYPSKKFVFRLKSEPVVCKSSAKKMFLKIFSMLTGKPHMLLKLKPHMKLKLQKETPAQMFSC